MIPGELAYKQLVEHLKEVRIACNIHQGELAARLDRDQSYVSRVERGKSILGLVEFVLWARALELDPSEEMRAFAKAVPTTIHRIPAATLES